MFLPENPDFDYSKGVLPRRGIPYAGYSNPSGINLILGQLGIVFPYYSDILHGISDEEAAKAAQHWTSEKEVSRYSELTKISAGAFPDQTLPIYATIDG